MSNEFTVLVGELVLLDEDAFLANGGEELWFGALEGATVRLHATGSPESIRGLARTIVAHHTAAC